MKLPQWATFSNLLVFCLAICVVAIFAKAYINQNEIGTLLALAGTLLGGLALISVYKEMSARRKQLLSIGLLGVCILIFIALKPEECKINDQTLTELEAKLHKQKDKFIADHSKEFRELDSTEAAHRMKSLYNRLIDDLINGEEIKTACHQKYRTKLTQWSDKETLQYFENRKIETSLCRDINLVIDKKDEKLISLLLADYNIDENAVVLQYYENPPSAPVDLGKFKLLLEGIIINEDDPVRFKIIINIERNNTDQKIIKIGFINQEKEKL